MRHLLPRRDMKPPRVARQREEIERIGYRPAAPYALDIEIFSMRSLRRRVAAKDLGTPHRLDFQQLVCVTEGRCTHVIDFEPVRCEPGSVLVHQPSQTEQYDVKSAWDGWIVLFRPEFLFMPSTEGDGHRDAGLNLVGVLSGLPRHLALSQADLALVRAAIGRMHADARLDVAKPEVDALLRYQLCAVLMRLRMAQLQREDLQPAAMGEIHRFRRFRQLLDESFQKWHRVTQYASVLGCSDKTLTRATSSVAGVTAKALIASRISLEGKRLLVHTALPVATIADKLGFDDPSNFVKFFKREAGCTPLELRRKHQPK
jgi:AraC-like DNA-binding protein